MTQTTETIKLICNGDIRRIAVSEVKSFRKLKQQACEWFGLPDDSFYFVQADVEGTKVHSSEDFRAFLASNCSSVARLVVTEKNALERGILEDYITPSPVVVATTATQLVIEDQDDHHQRDDDDVLRVDQMSTATDDSFMHIDSLFDDPEEIEERDEAVRQALQHVLALVSARTIQHDHDTDHQLPGILKPTPSGHRPARRSFRRRASSLARRFKQGIRRLRRPARDSDAPVQIDIVDVVVQPAAVVDPIPPSPLDEDWEPLSSPTRAECERIERLCDQCQQRNRDTDSHSAIAKKVWTFKRKREQKRIQATLCSVPEQQPAVLDYADEEMLGP